MLLAVQLVGIYFPKNRLCYSLADQVGPLFWSHCSGLVLCCNAVMTTDIMALG